MPDKSTKLRLDAFLPFRLAVLSNAVSTQIRKIYEEEFRLSMWEWRVIAILGEDDGLTSTAISDRAFMDKPLVSRTVTALQNRGLLLRTRDTRDRRREPLKLTSQGRAIYDVVAPRALSIERSLVSAFSDAEFELFESFLQRLADIASAERRLWKTNPMGHDDL